MQTYIVVLKKSGQRALFTLVTRLGNNRGATRGGGGLKRDLLKHAYPSFNHVIFTCPAFDAKLHIYSAALAREKVTMEPVSAVLGIVCSCLQLTPLHLQCAPSSPEQS
jgi:hypothetical protein